MAAVAAGCSTAGPAGPGSATPGSTSQAGPSAPAGVHTEQDSMYLLMLTMNGQQAVQLAKLAPGRGSAAVRALAAQIAASDSSQLDPVADLLDSWDVTMADMDMDPGSYFVSSRQITALRSASGTAFDSGWLQTMSRLNANTIELSHSELQFGQDAATKAVAQAAIDACLQQNTRIGALLAK